MNRTSSLNSMGRNADIVPGPRSWWGGLKGDYECMLSVLGASTREGEPSCHNPGGTPYGASAKRAVAAFRGQVCPPSVLNY